jgi:hypothetical protein
MVITKEGPVSMCKHNANRDDYILQPIQIEDGDKTFYPLPTDRKAEPVMMEAKRVAN